MHERSLEMDARTNCCGLLLGNEQGLSPLMLVSVFIGVMALVGMYLLLFLKHYKRCPPNRLLVIWGRADSRNSLKVMHGGAQFVLPLLQDYAYLSLEPINVELSLSTHAGAAGPGIALPRKFTVAISTVPELSRTAAVRLLGLNTKEIVGRAEEIIGCAIAHTLDSISGADRDVDREAFYRELDSKISSGLKELGLELVSMKRV